MKQNSESVSALSNEERNSWAIRQITDAMLSLMETKSPEEISISELCQSAGVGRATFYRNFQSRDEILAKKLHSIFLEWFRQLEEADSGSLSGAMEQIFRLMLLEKDFFSKLTRRNRLDLLKQEFLNLYQMSPQRPMAEAYSIAYVSYAFYGWVETWLLRGMKDDPKELCALFPNQEIRKEEKPDASAPANNKKQD